MLKCFLIQTFLTASFLFQFAMAEDSSPLVIAHRGASGYLPEHTLASAAMAHGSGAHYIEPDVILTKDNVPIVFHDIHLDSVTDVAKVFSGRARPDGHFYAIDAVKTLNKLEDGGVLRVGFMHYNTEDEIDRFFSALVDVMSVE